MKKGIVFLLLILSFASCKKILDKRDISGVGPEIWDNESTANLYLNNLYGLIMPTWPANAGSAYLPNNIHNTSDESNTTGSTAILQGTLTADGVNDIGSAGSSGALAYSNLRKVNTLITEIDNGKLSYDVRRNIKAQAYFLRAWIMFQLTKIYGGMPYLTKPQDWLEDDLFVARNKSSECIDMVVRDLDSAAAALPGGTQAAASAGNRGRINKDAAMAFKGRVLLYWASPQFNPANNPERWLRAYDANKAAYTQLLLDHYALHPNFSQVLLDKGATNSEVIIIRSMDGNQNINMNYNSFENSARPSSEGSGGGYQPTWNLVKAFPMANGLPITDPASGYDSVYYWKNRDPRFYATIAYNGCVWGLSNNASRKQWIYQGTSSETSVSSTGFYCRKGVNTTTPKTIANFGTTDWVEMRFAEVMLNLAECANYTSHQTESYDMLKAIRARAGVAAGTNGLYGLAAAMSTTDMFNTIINERRIEFAFENKRYDDLRRTKLFSALNGSYRQKLVITVKAPYTAAILNTALLGGGTYVRDTINIDGPSYTQFFTATVTNFDAVPINFLPAYYFYAIPSTHISKNPKLEQVNTWGGPFDPLQ